jgi:sulfur relay protein TusB/DsrH
MSTLHIFNKGTLFTQLLKELLQAVSADDSVLFIEDGVVWACYRQLPALLQEMAATPGIFALHADLFARALEKSVQPGISAISDAEFVALAVRHSRSISWF